jgi:hypothetical protein
MTIVGPRLGQQVKNGWSFVGPQYWRLCWHAHCVLGWPNKSTQGWLTSLGQYSSQRKIAGIPYIYINSLISNY